MSDPSDAGPPGLCDAPAQTDALLHEIDHRVKNNLQLVASLILLQNRRATDEAARAALGSVLARVNAVATVHRRLFQGDPSSFDVADFVRDLAGDLAAAARRDDLEIALDLDRVCVPAAAAAPLALVVNELLGNALKHAFPPPRGGRIAVSLRGGEGSCRLSIADDGIGLGGQPPGFGLTVVKLLCQQLHAEFEIADTAPGVRASVAVPIAAPMAVRAS
ncbi:sensor histidine kinase [Phenylobacterium sp.]|uniref:sensor histidine kinase n=1 Tax=Phenylobacterium sp. TaxID=1871053 RepID=UPI002BF2B479|nr:sensor histidine kinase [Phenylobacterium sp.]HLZ74994.1 sensor histidine kinase [Phenylobacterium sp.]